MIARSPVGAALAGVAVALALLAAFPSRAGELKAGTWRVVRRGRAPEWRGEAFAVATNPQCFRGANRKVVARWEEPKPDDFGNKPEKLVLLFSRKVDGTLANPFQTKERAKAWFNLADDEQENDYLIECAPDVRALVDTNDGKTKGYWTGLWIVVERSNGKRAPLAPATLETATGDEAVPANAIRIPLGYEWPSERILAPPAAPEVPKTPPAVAPQAPPAALEAGAWRVLRRGEVPEWKGAVWEAGGDGVFRGSRRKVVVRWPECQPDAAAGKPKKLVLFFSKNLATSAKNPFRTKASTKAWFELKEKEEQASYAIECSPDVRTLVDLNAGGGDDYWQNLWLVVEFEDGKRLPFVAPSIATWTGDEKLVANAIRLPEDYRFSK